MPNNLHVGIIGYGKMGKIRARVIKATGEGNVVAIYDPSNDLATDEYLRAATPEQIIENLTPVTARDMRLIRNMGVSFSTPLQAANWKSCPGSISKAFFRTQPR